jgi:hypothetical protein
MADQDPVLEEAKRIMARLVSAPPKPHSEMKVEKKRESGSKVRKRTVPET